MPSGGAFGPRKPAGGEELEIGGGILLKLESGFALLAVFCGSAEGKFMATIKTTPTIVMSKITNAVFI